MPYFKKGDTIKMINGDIAVIDRLIGEGSMAQVYLCISTQLRCRAALKFMFGDYSTDRELYYRKCRILAHNPPPHPAMTWFYPDAVSEFQSGSKSFAYLMPYLDGYRDFVEAVKDRSVLSFEQRVSACEQLAGLFGTLHENYVYGDISAKNALYRLDPDGTIHVRLIDPDNVTLPGHSLGLSGTGLYRAPEVIRGGAPSAESDRHALAVLAFRLFLGRHPLDTEEVRQHPFTPENVVQWFGKTPRFLFDGSAEPVPAALRGRWDALPEPLRLLFRYMFSRSCLKDPGSRPDCRQMQKIFRSVI